MPELTDKERSLLHIAQAKARAAFQADLAAKQGGNPAYAAQIRADYQPLIDFKEEVVARGNHRH